MEMLAFFAAGLPLAFAANRLVLRLTDYEAEESERRLPWQQGAWPDRTRRAVLLLLPLSMAVAAARFDLAEAAAVSLLLAALLVCTATDMLRFRVPNAITYPGIAAALAASLLMPDGDFATAALAALLAGGVFLVLAVVTAGGIGLGDAKLAALIGASLGLPFAYQALLYGVIAAAVVMVVLLLAGVVSRRQAIPYAPFLALAAVAVVLLQGTAFAST